MGIQTPFFRREQYRRTWRVVNLVEAAVIGFEYLLCRCGEVVPTVFSASSPLLLTVGIWSGKALIIV
jgi:hypothetical protein